MPRIAGNEENAGDNVCSLATSRCKALSSPHFRTHSHTSNRFSYNSFTVYVAVTVVVVVVFHVCIVCVDDEMKVKCPLL